MEGLEQSFRQIAEVHILPIHFYLRARPCGHGDEPSKIIHEKTFNFIFDMSFQI